jgi:hypothetical protein
MPFIVLPSKPEFWDRQQLADLRMVFNNDTGKCSWAICADVGPSNDIGKGSMALCEALGIDNGPKTGGTDQQCIAMVYFAGFRIGWPLEASELQAKTYQLFSDWGGYDPAAYAMPQFDWSQFPPLEPTTTTSPPSSSDLVVTIPIDAPAGVKVDVSQNPTPKL